MKTINLPPCFDGAPPLSLYIHWPFCAAKCFYCDFNSRPLGDAQDEAAWAQAYGRELAYYNGLLPERTITTIYFGGGTPSLMRPQTVASVLEKIAALWPLSPECEITLEANPTSAESGKLKDFRAAGVNRLSLGVQSLDDEALRFLGRTHDAAQAREAMTLVARTFDRFSFDFIYARQGQTMALWRKELAQALTFKPCHLSLYQLTIEEGSIFYKRADADRAMLTLGEDDAAQMFEATQEILTDAGLPPYEISNYAAEGQESRHNLTYWHYNEYLGIGPGAHGRYVQGGARFATENHRAPKAWMENIMQSGHGRAAEEKLSMQTAMREALLMGLRLSTGIDKTAWTEKFDTPLESFLPQTLVQALEQGGFLENSAKFFRATSSGRQRLNAVLERLSG